MKNDTRHPELDSGSNIQKLRFPEFVNDGEWEEKNLSNLSAIGLSNGVFNDPKKVGSGYKLINVSDMYIESTINEETLSLIEISENEFLKNKVENGDIFFTRSSLVKSGIACSNIYLGTLNNITFDGHLIRFRPNKETVVPIFINYILKTNYIRSQLIARGKTATMTTIGQSDVAEVKFFIPFRIAEQQKIADCLSSVDSLISAQSQKVELLKEHKKALMQQLFPQDGEEVPKLRFPEFINATKWEEKKLGDICDITNGKANAQDHIEDGIYPLFDRSAVVKQTNNYLFDCEAVIIPGEGMRFIPKYYKGKFDLHQRAYALQNFKCDAKFIYYSMNFLKEVLATKAVQSTVLSLRLPILQNFMISMPPDKDTKEQQKIADFLSSIDEQIGSQTRKLQTLKEHKKALMQQLFPSKEAD